MSGPSRIESPGSVQTSRIVLNPLSGGRRSVSRPPASAFRLSLIPGPAQTNRAAFRHRGSHDVSKEKYTSSFLAVSPTSGLPLP